jgi:glucose-1-phosphate cytidylyltransferase
MKAVILAGGLGTRLSEETHLKPKPMVEIGNYPILWHVMKIYSRYGINDFVICAGYKGYVIKEYFANYFMHMSNVTFDMKSNKVEFQHARSEPWTVTIVDTGELSMTGGRLRRVREYVGNETFCLTYGDGLSDVNVAELVAFHKAKKAGVTLTAVQPQARFGALEMDGDRVLRFQEKPKNEGGWINGGFFVMEPEVFNYLTDDATILEQEPLERLAADNRLSAYKHTGFWQAMDTLRDKKLLEKYLADGKAPWLGSSLPPKV